MYKKMLLFAVFLNLSYRIHSQDLVASQVFLALDQRPSNSTYKPSQGTFSLNRTTQAFTGVLELFPIVPSPDVQDSLSMEQRPLQLKIQGQFPAGDISFLTTQDNDKSYVMPCQCKIYDSVKSCAISFHLITFGNQPEMTDVGGSMFQARMSFEMEINPSDYGLTAEPFAINNPILIIVQTAVLNKVF